MLKLSLEAQASLCHKSMNDSVMSRFSACLQSSQELHVSCSAQTLTTYEHFWVWHNIMLGIWATAACSSNIICLDSQSKRLCAVSR